MADDKASASSTERMSKAIGAWTSVLQTYPGFREWNRKKIGEALWFQEPYSDPEEEIELEFKFSDEIEKQRALVLRYAYLQQTISAFRECEYYFRRYPFRGLPVSRHNHLINVCEMYFGRFYEFRERLKYFFEAVKAVNPDHGLELGKFIDLYDKVFKPEIRERHSVHHRERFGDIAIDRLFMTEMMSQSHEDKGWREEHVRAYQKAAQVWVKRVHRRATRLDQFLEAAADAALNACPFLLKALAAPATISPA